MTHPLRSGALAILVLGAIVFACVQISEASGASHTARSSHTQASLALHAPAGFHRGACGYPSESANTTCFFAHTAPRTYPRLQSWARELGIEVTEGGCRRTVCGVRGTLAGAEVELHANASELALDRLIELKRTNPARERRIYRRVVATETELRLLELEPLAR